MEGPILLLISHRTLDNFFDFSEPYFLVARGEHWWS